MAYHRSRSRGVGAKIIRRRKSLTSICHCSKDRSISLTLIIYPPNTQLLHSLAQFLHKFIPFFCVFHLGFGLEGALSVLDHAGGKLSPTTMAHVAMAMGYLPKEVGLHKTPGPAEHKARIIHAAEQAGIPQRLIQTIQQEL